MEASKAKICIGTVNGVRTDQTGGTVQAVSMSVPESGSGNFEQILPCDAVVFAIGAWSKEVRLVNISQCSI